MYLEQSQKLSQNQTQSLSQGISLKRTIDQHEVLVLSNRDLAEHVQRKVEENDYLEYCLNGRAAAVSPSRNSNLDGYGAIAAKPRSDRTQNHYAMLQNVAGSEHHTTSLGDHLLRQLPDLELDLEQQITRSFDRTFAVFLIHEISNAYHDPSARRGGVGMLPRSLVELRSEYEASFEPVTMETTKTTLQQLQHHLSPPGVGAETESERVSLLLQRAAHPTGQEELRLDQPLKHLGQLQEVVNNHLEDLKARRFEFVAGVMGITTDWLTGEVLPELQRLLSTRPFDDFLDSATGIVPEVVIRLSETGDLVVSASNRAIPRIRVPRRYLADNIESQELRKRVNSNGRERSRFDEANRLVATIEWRKEVLQVLAEELAHLQNDFFRYGPEHLTPLSQRTLAKCDRIRARIEPMRFEQLSRIKEQLLLTNERITREELQRQLAEHEENISRLLESRISRALKDKWMDTPHGIYPIRMCFLDNPTWVERNLHAIILSESKDVPYSDGQLAEELEKRRIHLKPDTVRKYRTKLGFESANRRRANGIKRPA